MHRIVLPVLLATGLLHAPALRAETTQCMPITSLPATLTTQGVYCLRQDLTTAIASGAAITIATNNVTLDCNERKVGGLAAGPATAATGIRADGRQNITVRNCGIRGFRYGLVLLGGAGHLVERNRIDQSTYVGIYVVGEASAIRDNRVHDTGGVETLSAYGIHLASGTGVGIVGNTIANVTADPDGDGDAHGVRFAGRGHEIRDNHIVNLMSGTTEDDNTAYGISGTAGSQAVIDGNSILNLVLAWGLGIGGGGGGSLCRDNSISGYRMAWDGCRDAGGNEGF